MDRKMDEMIRRGQEMQALYEKVEQANRELRRLSDGLPGMSEDIQRLLRYYQGEWIRDRDELGTHPVRDNLVFAEDPIYDEVQAWDELLEKLASQAAELLAAFRGADEP